MNKTYIKNNSGHLEQLKQCVNVTWDGDLISKKATKELREKQLVTSWNGFTVVTKEGLRLLTDLELIQA